MLTGAGETRGAGRGQRFLPERAPEAPRAAPRTLHPAPRRQRTAAGVCGCRRRGEWGSTSALRAEGVSGSTQGDAEGRRGNDPTGGRGAPLPLGADLPLAAPANGAPRPVSATVLKGGRQARSLVFGIVGRGDILLFRRCPGDGGPPPLHRRGLGGAHEHASRARPPIRGYRTRNFLRKATLLPRGVVTALERNSWSGLCAFGLSRKRPRLMFD